jgi:PHD/YefM family antitoxin component YafN of YafNO toxin-antitoxin module
MINLSRDIDSLSNFKRDTSGFLERLKKSGEPVVLTINGKAELVVQDAGSYQRLLEAAEQLESFEVLRRSLEDVDAGRTRPMRKALASLGKRKR